MHEARHVRPRWEVESLLMNSIAEYEANREDRREDIQVVPNPDDTPAPGWVGDLPT